MKYYRKNIRVLILPLIGIVTMILGISYALYTKNISTNNRTISMTSGNKYVGVYGENKNNIELGNTYTFTIENRGSVDAGFELYIVNETEIDLSTINYTITGDKSATGTLNNTTILSGGIAAGDIITINVTLTSSSSGNYVGKIKANTLGITASEVTYSNSVYTSCTNVQCALDEFSTRLNQ